MPVDYDEPVEMVEPEPDDEYQLSQQWKESQGIMDLDMLFRLLNRV